MLSALLNPTEAVRRGILVLLLIVVGALVTLAAYVMVWVIVVLRFFQLYVMLAMMPIPMASFASEEHDHIGKKLYQTCTSLLLSASGDYGRLWCLPFLVRTYP